MTTTNVANYIAAGYRSEIYDPDRWPRDNLADGWYVKCYWELQHYYVLFNDRLKTWSLYFKINPATGSRTFFSNYYTMSRERFMLLLRDYFPIPFEWCLFNLDLIGA